MPYAMMREVDLEFVSQTGSPPKVNQFVWLVGPITLQSADYFHVEILLRDTQRNGETEPTTSIHNNVEYITSPTIIDSVIKRKTGFS